MPDTRQACREYPFDGHRCQNGSVTRYRVFVTLKAGLLDTQGRAVGDALRSLGFDAVKDVRMGKMIEIEAEGADKSQVESMCQKLLANPVIEEYTIEALN